MTSLGVWSCQWRELQPINFGGSSAKAVSNPGSAAENGESSEGVGFPMGRGRGRGRNRDGGGDYEMAEIQEEPEEETV